MLRFLTAGESHGPGLVAIVEGLPSGLTVTAEMLSAELERRRQGHGRSRRMALERDDLEILGGVRFGRTTGAPVAVSVRNTEWPRWQEEMSPAPGEPSRPLTAPRPGHADLAGMLKYATHDARDVLERASARETAARTVVGRLAKELLATVGVVVISHVVAIGDATSGGNRPGPEDGEAVDASPVRCLDPAGTEAMVAAIDRAREARDTVGGVFEVMAYGVPAGLGSHVHWDRRLDATLAGAVMSIPGVKAVEIGDGFTQATLSGSAAHDEIEFGPGGWDRSSDRAGGIEGGISTGQPLRLRAAMKPLATLMRPLRTVDVVSKEPAEAIRERSDVCSVPAAAVVAEQMVAWVLASEALRVFGGDTVTAFVDGAEAHTLRLAGF